jgi:hypothetical protein
MPIRNRPRDPAGREAHTRDRPARGEALVREDLFRVLDAIGEGVKNSRDGALLLVGFQAGSGGRKSWVSIATATTWSASGKG